MNKLYLDEMIERYEIMMHSIQLVINQEHPKRTRNDHTCSSSPFPEN